MPTLTLLQLLFYSWQSLSFFYFLEDMYFLFKITFYHLVKQYIVLVKNENITDKSKVPLDFSLYRSSMATPSPLGSLCVCTHMPIHWSRCCQWPAPSLRPSLFWTTPTRLPNASTCISLPERFLCGHWCLLCPWAWQMEVLQIYDLPRTALKQWLTGAGGYMSQFPHLLSGFMASQNSQWNWAPGTHRVEWLVNTPP